MSTNSKSDAGENDGGNAEQPERPETPDMECSICLDEITDVCRTNMCRHLFCYKCLRQWSAIQSFCPMCKRDFNRIHHSFTEHGLYQVHNVSAPTSDISTSEPTRLLTGMTTRRTIYHANEWAEPLSDLNGHFRGVNSRFFRENPEQTIRMHQFIRRDVSVLMSLRRNETVGRLSGHQVLNINEEFVTNLITSLLTVFDILDGYMVDMLQPYIGRDSQHFFHELYNFANSPYDNAVDYDLNVRYLGGVIDMSNPEQFEVLRGIQNATRVLRDIDTVAVGSNVEENIDSSEVEFNDTTSRPIETYELPPAVQPFTSTGIRDALGRLSNRNNLTSRSYSTSRFRILDCPSSDENSTGDVPPVSKTICRKRKRRFEINQSKKMKKSTDQQQKTVRKRKTHSEFSSSEDEDV